IRRIARGCRCGSRRRDVSRRSDRHPFDVRVVWRQAGGSARRRSHTAPDVRYFFARHCQEIEAEGTKMKIAVCGFDGPVARATRAELTRRGHTVFESGMVDSGMDSRVEGVIWFPGDIAQLERIAGRTDLRRLVI